jgi:hypothetical protein
MLLILDVMLPWRIYHLKYQNSLKWVFTGDLMIQNQLRSSDSFLNGGEWLLIGGANTACRVDKVICDKVDEDSKKLVIKTWITNPVEWYNIKFEIIDEYWFSEIKNWTKPKVYENVDFNKIFNFIVLIIIIISILYLLINKNSKTNDNLLLIWIYFSLILSYKYNIEIIIMFKTIKFFIFRILKYSSSFFCCTTCTTFFHNNTPFILIIIMCYFLFFFLK